MMGATISRWSDTELTAQLILTCRKNAPLRHAFCVSFPLSTCTTTPDFETYRNRVRQQMLPDA